MIAFRRTNGFSLTELLFAMAVGTIILLAASAFLGSSTEGYSRITGNVSGERESRSLFSELSSELSSAVFQEDMAAVRDGSAWAKGRLAFLSLLPGDSQAREKHIGDLCAVHYYVGDLNVGGQVVRCVMRGFRDSKDVFDALHNDTVPGLFTPDPVADEPIVMRVVSFDVRPQVVDGNGRWVDAPVPVTSAPAAVKVRLVVARPSLSGRMRDVADWDGASPIAARDLGNPEEADRNPYLQVHESVIPFAPHASR